MTKIPPSLAVIVIARNEERTIEDCLKACLEATARARSESLISRYEVVLVDSASEDRTRDIARRYPVRVLALQPSWPLSAAAGRFVGFLHTESDVVLFVDGDYVLDPNWLPIGLRALDSPSVAGVCGVDNESLPGRSRISRYVQSQEARSIPQSELIESEAIAVGLYWRSWVVLAGGIQPFLRGAEDRDLAIRVRAAGGRLLKTKAVLGTHHWAPGADLTLVEYFRSVAGWSYGEGQAARRASREPEIRRVYLRRYFHLRHLIHVELALLLAGWATAVVAPVFLDRAEWALAIFGGGLLAVGFEAWRTRRGLVDVVFDFHAAVYVLIRLASFVMGFAHSLKSASKYPRELPSGD